MSSLLSLSSSFNILRFLFENVDDKLGKLAARTQQAMQDIRASERTTKKAVEVVSKFPYSFTEHYLSIDDDEMIDFATELNNLIYDEVPWNKVLGSKMFNDLWQEGVSGRKSFPLRDAVITLKQFNNIPLPPKLKVKYFETLNNIKNSVSDAVWSIGLANETDMLGDIFNQRLRAIEKKELPLITTPETLYNILSAIRTFGVESKNYNLTRLNDMSEQGKQERGDRTAYKKLSPGDQTFTMYDADEQVKIYANVYNNNLNNEIPSLVYSFKYLYDDNRTGSNIVLTVTPDKKKFLEAHDQDPQTWWLDQSDFDNDYDAAIEALEKNTSSLPETVLSLIRAQGIDL